MEALSIKALFIGLLAAGPALAADTAVRNWGRSDTLRALALAPVLGPQVARGAEPPLHPALRSEEALRAVSTSAAPHYALPSLPARPPLPLLRTGAAGLQVEGMRAGHGNVSGAVGDLQYVQLADGLMTVYRKDDGARLLGPVAVNAMFADGPADADAGMRACGAARQGAGAVLFDQLAKRWIVSYRAWQPGQAASGPYYLCLAVSASSDATASYHRHALAIQGAAGQARYFDDPQLALWADAYYLSVNLYQSATGSYLGPRVCGIQREALLRGADARMRCRDLGAAAAPLVVASAEGYAGPERRDSAALFLSLGLAPEGRGKHLLLWRFSYSADLLEGPLAIPVAPFTIACPEGDACVSQPAPGAKLTAVGDRLMPHPVYRNDDGRDSLVASHSVQMLEGQLGVRWYEIRDPFGAPRAYQQGSFAPDGASRWSASIGVDKAGNIALGYSVAAGDTPPGIRYSGRERTDPPGRMRAEQIVFNGAGVEPRPGRAVGTSGALSIDPADGCTFWYTQHYLPSTGPANWRTRIASFKFEACQ